MLTISIRRLVTGLVAAAVSAVSIVAIGVAPAHAVASGYLLEKGSGSVYSRYLNVHLGVVPGGSAKTWYYKVVNSGPSTQQFKIKVAKASPVTATLLQGSKVLPPTYYTAPIAPGKSLTFSLKISVAAGTPIGVYGSYLELRDPETNTVLDSGYAYANATYQTGSTRNDVFVKTGSQPFVGGSFTQYETGNALNPGGSAVFVVRLKNDGGAPASMRLDALENVNCPSSFSMVVKQGTKDVTAAVAAGSYDTGFLVPGAKIDLKVTIKLLSVTSCAGAEFGFQTFGADGSRTSYALVMTGV